jgi:hypothetical protein
VIFAVGMAAIAMAKGIRVGDAGLTSWQALRELGI